MTQDFTTAFALSQAPVLVLFSYVYLKDKHDREPLSLLLKTFAAGALSSVVVVLLELLFTTLPSLPINRIGHVFFDMLVGVALVEELAKYIVLRRVAYPRPEFNEPYDGIMYGVTAALGFAAIENLLYVLHYGAEIGWLRMLTAVPMHAVCGVLMGFYVGLAKFSVSQRKARVLAFNGLALAVITHGSYNYFLRVAIPMLTPLAFLVLAVQLGLALKAIGMYRNKAPLTSAAGFYASLPLQDSLISNKLRWSVWALWLPAIVLFLSALRAVTEAPFGADLLLGAGLFITLAAFLLTVALALEHGSKLAWRISFALFVLMLPTPICIVGITGLYGLLAPVGSGQ
jgi:protease PrsW